jgi:lysyl-tRNA synthetase class 1
LKADGSNPATFNPHDVEHAAKRLIKHYGRAHRRDDVKRLHTEIARAFEHFASLSDPMLASAVLQTAVNSYRAAGSPAESQRVRVLMQEKTNQARTQMQPISTEIKITLDDMEASCRYDLNCPRPSCRRYSPECIRQR